jgi:phage-related protein
VCEFSTISKQGLKTHMNRKHSEYENAKFSLPCELCEKVLIYESELKKHMNSHNYRKAAFKCEERDFVSGNEWSMEVHHERMHTEILEC